MKLVFNLNHIVGFQSQSRKWVSVYVFFVLQPLYVIVYIEVIKIS